MFEGNYENNVSKKNTQQNTHLPFLTTVLIYAHHTSSGGYISRSAKSHIPKSEWLPIIKIVRNDRRGTMKIKQIYLMEAMVAVKYEGTFQHG